MMPGPLRGLSLDEICLPKKHLYTKHGVYFSAMMMCMWDNIHGPKVLNVWTGDEPLPAPPPYEAKLAELSKEGEVVGASQIDPKKLTKEIKEQLATSVSKLANSGAISDATLLSVANYTLNDEAGRVERLDGIETKFYSLIKYDVIATAFVFATEVVRGKTEVFSFILVLPYSEMSDYLARHSLCEVRVQKILKNHFISPLQELYGKPLREKIEKAIDGFCDPLLKFTQTMRKLSQYPLPEKISVSDTFLGKDLQNKCFLPQAIACHLQTSGYTVVLGSNRETVNKTILTLALFLSPKERKMSRLVCSDLRKVESDVFEPDVFLQGFVVVPDPNASLPFTRRELYSNKLPPNLLNCDTGEIRLVEPKIPLFIRQREDFEAENKQITKSSFFGESSAVEFSSFKGVEKEWHSPLVSNFIDQMKLLPLFPGVRESFVFQYLRLLKLKSLAMAKYIDTEPKATFQEMAIDVLSLGRGAISERPKVNKIALMQNLSIDCYGDLLVLLAFAERIRPKTYMDVLGDPHLNDLAMIKEFETF